MKRCISVLLTVCLLLACTVPAFASDAPVACTCGNAPIVVVSGVGSRPFLLDAGTENERIVFPPQQVNVGKIVLRGLGSMLLSAMTWDIHYFADAAADIAMDMLGVLSLDGNGNSVYNVSTMLYDDAMSEYDPALYTDAESAEFAIINAAVKAIGADHVYFYNYDWRLDPMRNAADLDAYIRRVQAETGHEKVRLAAISMGGIQTMSYLSLYGPDSIDTVWFLSAAWNGLLFVTNVFAGELILSQKSFFSWLQTLDIGNARVDAVFDRLFGFCAETPLLRPVFTLINRLGMQLNDAAVYRVISQTLGSTAGMWAFVRDERYEEAKQKMLSDTPETFIRMLDDYHYNVANRRDEIIAEAEEAGVQFAVVSHYNNGCVPITSSAQAHGDSLIETVCTSGGAVVAEYGSRLPADYKQRSHGEHNHLSADGVIDASACLFPDRTWFIKNMSHVGCNKGSAFADMLQWLFAQQQVPTVFDNAQYPQFLQTDPFSEMTLEPVTE